MRKIASHYLFCGTLYRLHYAVEEEGKLAAILPLCEEAPGITFLDGTVIILPAGEELTPERISRWVFTYETRDLYKLLEYERVTSGIRPGDPIALYRLPRLTPAAPEFSADDSRRDSHIQRL